MAFAELDVEKYLNNDRVNARIILPKGDTGLFDVVKTYLISDFSFSLGNNWGQLASISDFPMLDQLSSLFNMIMTIGSAGGSAQGTLESVHLTAASWKGSKIPSFSVDCLFIATNYEKNPIKQILSLAQGALPSDTYDLSKTNNQLVNAIMGATNRTVSGLVTLGLTVGDIFENGVKLDLKSLSSGQTARDIAAMADKNRELGGKVGDTITQGSSLKAPFGYGLNAMDDSGKLFTPIPGTTVTLSVGNWFHAENLLIEDVSNISFSKEVIRPHPDPKLTSIKPGGMPLYGRCTVTLRPYKMITVKDFIKYFIGFGGN
jgi:hypothetical protein